MALDVLGASSTSSIFSLAWLPSAASPGPPWECAAKYPNQRWTLQEEQVLPTDSNPELFQLCRAPPEGDDLNNEKYEKA